MPSTPSTALLDRREVGEVGLHELFVGREIGRAS